MIKSRHGAALSSSADILIHLWRLILLLCAIHFVRFWILPGLDSLWIDEAGTYWTIAGGWDELWRRTALHPNSRLYGAILLAWTKVAGVSEIALRVPSLLAALGAIGVMGALLRRELGAGMAWPLVALCLASPELSFFALDARPYAFALLLLTVSTAAWINLHREMSWSWAIVWILSAGLLGHFHPVVSLALTGQFAWMAWKMDWRALTARRALAWCGIAVAAALVALPEVVRQMPMLWGDGVVILGGRPSAATAAKMVVPASIFGPALLAACALVLLKKWRPARLDGAAREMALLGLSIAAGMMGVAGAIYLLIGKNVFVTRYLIAIYPGCFLLLGTLLARWTDERGRILFVLLYSGSTLAISAFGHGWIPPHADADWRGAMAAVRQWEQDRPAPLLLQTGFIEGARAHFLDDPRWTEFLSSPALYYPHPGPTLVLPMRPNLKQRAYMEKLVPSVDGQRFSAIVYSGPGGGTHHLIALLAARNGQPRFVARVRRLEVYAFGPP